MDYFDFRPERVAINGFRSTMAGYELGDSSCWDEMWNTLLEETGIDGACRITGSLQFFVRSLRAAREGSLQYFPKSCRRLCTDECLVISLLASVQHNTTDTSDYCLEHLLKDGREIFADDLFTAATLLAIQMRLTDLIFLPVPLEVVKSVIDRSCLQCIRLAVQ